MTLITKAILAQDLGISRARVSQYAKQGLPVRGDGKLDRETTLTWLSKNVLGPVSSTASELLGKLNGKAPPTPPHLRALDDVENLFDKGIVLGLLEMCTRIRAQASIAAYEAGAGHAIAERIGNIALALFVNSASRFLKENGVEPFASAPDVEKLAFWPHPDMHEEVNWAALAKLKAAKQRKEAKHG